MRAHALVFLGGLVSTTLPAQPAGIPVTNWTVPPYTQSSSGGLTTMTDATPPRLFIGVQPCRIVDTRAGSGFPAGFGSPSLAAGVGRNFDLNNGPCPGLPNESGVDRVRIDAYSLNVTVVNPAGPGHLVIYPQGGTQPTVSSINYVAGQTIANAVIVPAGTVGGVRVIAGVSGTDLLIDINGYFSWTPGNQQNYLELQTNSPFYAALFGNSNPNCSGPCGVVVNVSGTNFTEAIRGSTGSSEGTSVGVVGQVISSGAQSAGIRGNADGPTNTTLYGPTGVRGHGSTIGVLGYSAQHGVMGDLVQADAIQARGLLGYDNGVAKFGVYATANGHVQGIFTAGNKMFVQPHPTDPTKEIRYVSLEGPSAEVYFRGSGRIQRGLTRIAIPEHFRLVARRGSYSTLVTPVGAMATVAVLSEDEDGIVVQSSRDVRIHYVVYAERDAFRDHQPIAESEHFRTKFEGSDNWHLQNLPESFTRLLVQNGTLNADGTANEETARRVGWTLRPALEAGSPSQVRAASD